MTTPRQSAVDNRSVDFSAMKVLIRVRPPTKFELDGAYTTSVEVVDEKMLVFDPKCDVEPIFRKAQGSRQRILKRKSKDLRMMFDRVFDDQATQHEVHNNSTKLILNSVLNGYNCSVFAYGATGSGKTYTMLGNNQSPGIIFLCMMELYQTIEGLKSEKNFEVAVSYIEVYNESVNDLLIPARKSLVVREDPQKGVKISGLSLHQPKSADELMQMLEFGNKNRTQHPTDANATSSRSHAVFQVYIKQKDRTAAMNADFKIAKLSLIDLAGSERATVTSNRGARMREGANINKSLLALGNCINALANNSQNGKKKIHIPYRDSKLTRLLKDSLGGNCRTVMIAAVSPSSVCYEDTYNTLRYADRAKSIKSRLKANVVSVNEHIGKYPKIVAELRAEVSDLRNKIKEYENHAVVNEQKQTKNIRQEVNKLRDDLLVVCNDQIAIRHKLLDVEAMTEKNDFKIYRKERNLQRLSLLSFSNKPEQNAVHLEQSIDPIKRQQQRLKSEKNSMQTQLADNVIRLQHIQNEIDKVSAQDDLARDLATAVSNSVKHEIKNRELKYQVSLFKRFAQDLGKEVQQNERLMVKLLQFIKNEFLELQKHNVTSTEIVQEYHNIMASIGHEREVAWADDSVCQFSGAASDVNFNGILSCLVQHGFSPLASSKAACITPSKYSRNHIGFRNVLSESLHEHGLKRKLEEEEDDHQQDQSTNANYDLPAIVNESIESENGASTPTVKKVRQQTPALSKVRKVVTSDNDGLGHSELHDTECQTSPSSSDMEEDACTPIKNRSNLSLLANNLATVKIMSATDQQSGSAEKSDLDSTFTVGNENNDCGNASKNGVVNKVTAGAPERIRKQSFSKPRVNTPRKPITSSFPSRSALMDTNGNNRIHAKMTVSTAAKRRVVSDSVVHTLHAAKRYRAKENTGSGSRWSYHSKIDRSPRPKVNSKLTTPALSENPKSILVKKPISTNVSRSHGSLRA